MSTDADNPTPPPLPVCPYCGSGLTSVSAGVGSVCGACRGLLDPLSKQATQNAMGPWFIRDEAQPFRPGCSLSTVRMLVERGKVTRETIVRGPTTRQFWMRAGAAPGVAHLLGSCHACRASVRSGDELCRACGVSFEFADDRQTLGLMPVRLLPGHAPASDVAQQALSGAPLGVARSGAAPRLGLTNAVLESDGTVSVAPEPEPPAPEPTLSSEERQARFAHIEAQAREALRESRERAGKRNLVIGVLLGLVLLMIAAGVLIAVG